jgi:hypothetical protein
MSNSTLKTTHQIQQAATWAAKSPKYVAHSHGIYEAPLTPNVPPEVSQHLPSYDQPEHRVGNWAIRVAFIGDRLCPPVRELGILSNIVSIIRPHPDGHRDIVNYCLGQQTTIDSSLVLRRLVTHAERPPMTPAGLKSRDYFPDSLKHRGRALSRDDIVKGSSPLLADLNIPPEFIDISHTSPFMAPEHVVDFEELRAVQDTLETQIGWE